MIGAKTKPMTSTTVVFEVPTAASASSAMMTSGSACSASITRLTTSSMHAAEIADARGRARCRAPCPSSVASGATVRMSRAPTMTREKHVAAELVGAEPMVGRRRRERREQIVGVRIDTGDQLAPNSAQTIQNARSIDAADERGRAEREAAGARARRLRRLLLSMALLAPAGSRSCHALRARIRGLSAALRQIGEQRGERIDDAHGQHARLAASGNPWRGRRYR